MRLCVLKKARETQRVGEKYMALIKYNIAVMYYPIICDLPLKIFYRTSNFLELICVIICVILLLLCEEVAIC